MFFYRLNAGNKDVIAGKAACRRCLSVLFMSSIILSVLLLKSPVTCFPHPQKSSSYQKKTQQTVLISQDKLDKFQNILRCRAHIMKRTKQQRRHVGCPSMTTVWQIVTASRRKIFLFSLPQHERIGNSLGIV